MANQEKIVSGEELWRWRLAAITAAKSADISPKEVDWILQEVAGFDRLTLRLESFKDWSKIELTMPFSQLIQLWQKRIEERLPVQYITGITPWRNFSLIVSPAVLIPRPETEYLIDLAREAVERGLVTGKTWEINQHFSRFPITNTQSPIPPHWVDLGTGSGAIAIGLADTFPYATIHAVDQSADALSIAQKNAGGLGFADRISFYQGCWFEPLQNLRGKLTGMVSNPPYIPSGIIPDLQPEVTRHEPHLALDGGADGLDAIRILVAKAPEFLLTGGVWLVETMAGQASAVVELLENEGSYCQIQVFSDLAGIDRFVLAYIKGA